MASGGALGQRHRLLGAQERPRGLVGLQPWPGFLPDHRKGQSHPASLRATERLRHIAEHQLDKRGAGRGAHQPET